MRKQHADCADKEEVLNRSVRPSSFKLFEKRQPLGGSPHGSNNSRHLNHTTQLTGGHRHSRADSGSGCITNPTDNANCFGGVVLPVVCSSHCEQRWKSVLAKLAELENRLELTNLKLQESATGKDLESTKQLDTFNRLVNLEKRAEKIEYNMWEMREIGKGEKQEAERLTQRLTEVGQQLKMDAKLLEQRVDQLQSGQSPEDLRQRIESVRTDQNRKLKSMYEALEEMGNLQASLVESVNGLKGEWERATRESATGLNSLMVSHNKENLFPKYNTGRADEQWKAASRKPSQY